MPANVRLAQSKVNLNIRQIAENSAMPGARECRQVAFCGNFVRSGSGLIK
jgi:hypothetical protein